MTIHNNTADYGAFMTLKSTKYHSEVDKREYLFYGDEYQEQLYNEDDEDDDSETDNTPKDNLLAPDCPYSPPLSFSKAVRVYENTARYAGGVFFIFEPYPEISFDSTNICFGGYDSCDNVAGYYGDFAAGTMKKLVPGYPRPYMGQRFDVNVTLMDRNDNIVTNGVTQKRQQSRLTLRTGQNILSSGYYEGIAYFRGFVLSAGSTMFEACPTQVFHS